MWSPPKARGLSKRAIYIKEQRKVIVDPLSLMWNVIAFVLFLWAATYVDTDLVFAVKAILAFCIGMCGFFMFLLTSPGAKWDKGLDEKELNLFIYAIAACSFASLVINLVTREYMPKSLASTPMGMTLFTVLVGVQEENFCRGWLQGLLSNLFDNDLMGILFSNGVFVLFHSAVYGLDLPALLIVGGCGIFLGVIFSVFRRLSITQTAHGLTNLLAGLALRLKP